MCYNPAMIKRVRIATVTTLVIMFFTMLGYTYTVYSSPKSKVQGVTLNASPTPQLLPTGGPSKDTMLSHNTDANGLASPFMTNVATEKTGNAGQSALPTIEPDNVSNNDNNSDTTSGVDQNDQGTDGSSNETEDDTPTPTPIPDVIVTIVPTEVPVPTVLPTPEPTAVQLTPTISVPTPTILPTLVPEE